jgi:hypothetical protein
MSLMTRQNGRAHVRRLCRRIPGKTQYSHGHPVFSLDDQWVLYNSKIGETHSVFMADVKSIALDARRTSTRFVAGADCSSGAPLS